MPGIADQHEEWRAVEPGADPAVSGASGEVGFKAGNRRELLCIDRADPVRAGICESGRSDKGLVRRYIAKLTGLSRAQVTRLIGKIAGSGTVQVRRGSGRRFTSHYSPADIGLSAQVDEAHDTLSGPATQKIPSREFFEFADARYERLANISAAHIYNLRKRRSYREKRMAFTKTRPTPTAIGERRRPDPDGRPGYLRVDTVHQGDLDGIKGVYHIYAVDEVTQWQIVQSQGVAAESFRLRGPGTNESPRSGNWAATPLKPRSGQWAKPKPCCYRVRSE